MSRHFSSICSSVDNLSPNLTFSISRYSLRFSSSLLRETGCSSFLESAYLMNSDSLMTISLAFSGSVIVRELTEFRLLKRKWGLICDRSILSSVSVTRLSSFASLDFFSDRFERLTNR